MCAACCGLTAVWIHWAEGAGAVRLWLCVAVLCGMSGLWGLCGDVWLYGWWPAIPAIPWNHGRSENGDHGGHS
jgi:hypothetical protein